MVSTASKTHTLKEIQMQNVGAVTFGLVLGWTWVLGKVRFKNMNEQLLGQLGWSPRVAASSGA